MKSLTVLMMSLAMVCFGAEAMAGVEAVPITQPVLVPVAATSNCENACCRVRVRRVRCKKVKVVCCKVKCACVACCCTVQPTCACQ